MENLLSKTCLFLFFVVLLFDAHAQTNTTNSLRIDSLKKILQTQKEDTNKINTLNELSSNLMYADEYDKVIQVANENI